MMLAPAAVPAIEIVQLFYDENASQQVLTHAITSPKGKCAVSLHKDPDISGNVVVFELELRCPSVAGKKDLITQAYPWHGYQVNDFAASDFAGGAGKSSYGATRLIRVPRAHLSLSVKIDSVQVSKIEAAPNSPDYEFNSFHISISGEPLK